MSCPLRPELRIAGERGETQSSVGTIPAHGAHVTRANGREAGQEETMRKVSEDPARVLEKATMNIRLSPEDQAYVRLLQEHFKQCSPLQPKLGNAEIVRTALRAAAIKAGISNRDVAAKISELRGGTSLMSGPVERLEREKLQRQLDGAA